MVKNFTQAITALALLILIPTTDVAHASCSDDSDCEDDEVEEVIVIGQRPKKRVIFIGGGNEAPAPSYYQRGRGGGSADRRPGPEPAEPDAKGKKVKECADKAGENIFAKAAATGKVQVNYSAKRMFHEGSRVHRHARWLGDSVEITIYHQNNADLASDRGVSFWSVFAETLLHEHHHALDMLNCNCATPDVAAGMTLMDYELATVAKAQADYRRLFSGSSERESCLTD